MNFQNEMLPRGAKKVGATPNMTQDTAVKGILKNHLAPKGKYALVVVEEGALQFVWENDKDNIIDGDKNNPIVIEPERFHHVVITGDVVFRVEFYEIQKDGDIPAKNGERPGEVFCECMG